MRQQGGAAAAGQNRVAGLAADGVCVNAVLPASGESAAFAAMAQNTPMKRCATPEEVAEAILFLARDAFSYVTSAELAVDGGYTAA